MSDMRRAKERRLRPESLMMSLGYKPELSEGAVKPPIFMASTWLFPTAKAGGNFFARALGKKKRRDNDGLIYSRFNHPGMQMFEERLCEWEGAEACAAFSSGMSAIFTTIFTFLKPGDTILHSDPLYGGTDGLFKRALLERMGVRSIGFTHTDSYESVTAKARTRKTRIAAVFVETPANPTNVQFDLALCSRLARRFRAPLIVDNTLLGPLYQQPLEHGADLVVYSCTKYIGGFSTVIAGAALGSAEHITKIKKMRGMIGDMFDPFTAWVLLNSLETLKIRMKAQTRSAKKLARFLAEHKKVARVYYPGLLDADTSPEQHRIYRMQCSGPGALISFDVRGGKKAAYRFLDALQEKRRGRSALIKLAVSLGSTESLAQHPASMTHAGVDAETKKRLGITGSMIRLSVGLENVKDLKRALQRALKKV